jgi:hypothetical protein
MSLRKGRAGVDGPSEAKNELYLAFEGLPVPLVHRYSHNAINLDKPLAMTVGDLIVISHRHMSPCNNPKTQKVSQTPTKY